MKTEKVIVGIIEKKHLMALLQNDKRLDERHQFESRPFTIETNILRKANGSAKVQLGKTTVYAGIKAELGTPFPDTPNKGVLIVNIELSPIASPHFESGPPTKEAIEMARVCDRALRESKVLDLDKLCVIPGEKVWIVFIDIYTIVDDGNLLDCASLAAMAALATSKLPILSYDLDSDSKPINYIKTDQTEPLPLLNYSTTITFSKIGDKILLDPSLAEEKIEELRFTVGMKQDGTITALQKGLSSGLTREELFNILDIAIEHGPIRINDLKEKIKDGATLS